MVSRKFTVGEWLAVIAILLSLAGGVAGAIWQASRVQSCLEGVERTVVDHESRLRGVEESIHRTEMNTQWLKDNLPKLLGEKGRG